MSPSSVSSLLPPSLQTSLGTVVITSLGWDTGTVAQCRCGFWKKYVKNKFEKISTPCNTFLVGHLRAAWRARVCTPVWARVHTSGHVSRAARHDTSLSGLTDTCDEARVSESGQPPCYTRPSLPRKLICSSSPVAEKRIDFVLISQIIFWVASIATQIRFSIQVLWREEMRQSQWNIQLQLRRQLKRNLHLKCFDNLSLKTWYKGAASGTLPRPQQRHIPSSLGSQMNFRFCKLRSAQSSASHKL